MKNKILDAEFKCLFKNWEFIPESERLTNNSKMRG